VIFVYFVVNKSYPKIEEKIGLKITLAKTQRTPSLEKVEVVLLNI
jgi:hypothetical protein